MFGGVNRRPEWTARARSRAQETTRGCSGVNANGPARQHVQKIRRYAALRWSQGRAQYTMQFDHYEPVPDTRWLRKIQKKFA